MKHSQPYAGRRTRTLIALWLSVAACHRAAEEEAVAAAVSVRTAIASSQPFTETVSAIGTVAPRSGHVASLAAPAPARINAVLVSPGQRVAAGTPVVELDPTPFQAATIAADATLLATEQALERARRLVKEGVSPRKDLEQATADFEKARGEAANARRQQELSTVRAPISGVVTRVNAMIGATADPTAMLVQIADPSTVDLLFTVTPTEAGEMRIGAKITVSAGQSAAGERLGVATVTDVGGIVDTASRGVTIRAQAPTTRRPLKIGETIFGEIVTVVRPRAVVVPIEALVPDGEAFKVFVVDATGVARERPVTVGGRAEKVAEITQGLAAGERVVTYGAYGIEDSARVLSITPETQSGAASPMPASRP